MASARKLTPTSLRATHSRRSESSSEHSLHSSVPPDTDSMKEPHTEANEGGAPGDEDGADGDHALQHVPADG